MAEEDIHAITRAVPKKFDGSQVLVNGGAGFIGSWLCETFLRLGASVTCVDNLSTSTLKNIVHLKSSPAFRFIQADICYFKFVKRYDFVIHAASIPAPEQYMANPVETMKASSLGLHRVLDYAEKTRAVVLYLSTSEVYGNARVLPTPETYAGAVDPAGPRSSYYESKRYGEAACMAYRRESGVDVRIARIFNTYGPRIDSASSYSRVVPRFITQCLSDEPITVYGDGRSTRSYCYISDTVVGLVLMLLSRRAVGQVINVGRSEETSVLQLARLIKQKCGSRSRVTHLPSRPDDPKRRCPDIAKAKRILGWAPKISLGEGLDRTISWFRADAERR